MERKNKETAPAPNKADSRKRQKMKGAAYKKNWEQNKLQSAETQGALRIGWMVVKGTMPTNVIG